MPDEQPRPQLGLVGAMNQIMYGPGGKSPMERAMDDLDRPGPPPVPPGRTAVRWATAAVVLVLCAAVMFLVVLGCIAMWHLVIG